MTNDNASSSFTAQSPAHDHEFYRRAAEDIYNRRHTPDAKALRDELVTQIRAGRRKADLWVLLKGVPGKWMNAAVDDAVQAFRLEDQQAVREKLAAAAADLSVGRTDGPSIEFALQLAQSLLMDDPRPEAAASSLEAAGCSRELADFLIAHPSTQTSQRDTSRLYFVGGVVLAAIGIGLVWVAYALPVWHWHLTESEHSLLFVGSLAFVLGAMAAVKGVRGFIGGRRAA